MATERYSILQKRVQELESYLNRLFSLPLDSDNPYHEEYTQDFDQKLDFLKTLLSTEIVSSPEKPQYHLQHIGQRVSELETAFRKWNEYKTPPHVHEETASTCLCNESCLNNTDGEVEQENIVVEGLIEEKAPVENERSVNVWWVCGSLGGGVVIGMLFMGFVMLKFCGCFSHGQSTMCLTPT
ncbi:hypothetical protein JCGZ_26252 [Jatropha curcas]|uniref:DUF7610 domain-containing protein n=1 Tax=Jatropha curcas TaxID=180498 RepID=A0A067JEU2_JATCU|nr:hypothetical protein JCGZ_26252 [Jatropha curcas]